MVKLTEGEKTLYNEMVKERKDAYANDLRTVMQMGAHSKGTKFGPGGKVLEAVVRPTPIVIGIEGPCVRR